MASVFAGLKKQEHQIHELEMQMSTLDPNSETFQQISATYDHIRADFEQHNGYGYDAEIRGVLHGFGFDKDQYAKPINELSGGQKTQLALAKLLLEKPELLILDEPTNHLDVETITWLEGYIQNYSGALLIISHDRYFLDRIVNEVYELANGTLRHYTGNYTQYTQKRDQELSLRWKAYEKQQAEIAKLQTFVDKNIVRASTTKQAQARRKQLEKMNRLEKPTTGGKNVRFRFVPKSKSGNNVLKVSDAAVGYTKVLSEPINLDVKRNQAIAIVGPNGVGKSTLLKSILGIIPFLKGTAQFGTGVDTGYYDQEQASLHASKTVLNEVWDDHPTTPEGDIRSILGSFLFSGDDVAKMVHDLSGGEKARLLLTKLAMQHNNFLVLDEPTITWILTAGKSWKMPSMILTALFYLFPTIVILLIRWPHRLLNFPKPAQPSISVIMTITLIKRPNSWQLRNTNVKKWDLTSQVIIQAQLPTRKITRSISRLKKKPVN
ncbi:ABC transporter ATP-binding protein uup [Lentilactobacillus farraginis DSM 18382 = JCM 14108]|uniref:ABC transporter ATP-binding protein uup n=1 Tax=Lentilactobacillus farraginis DSM 18382 = JCM 14108 TaxID=1423743 RepID=X0PHP1_9LACO|nr:ABC transporter ATP-binding protein uup [Lentilactobacillus farraginis DSM 18382 = JCM 14108]